MATATIWTINAETPRLCLVCATPFPPRHHHGHWQRYCSQACAQGDRFKKRRAALAVTGPDPKAWMLEHLNRGMTHETMAALVGMHRQALYAWWRDLGIRKVVRYE